MSQRINHLLEDCPDLSHVAVDAEAAPFNSPRVSAAHPSAEHKDAPRVAQLLDCAPPSAWWMFMGSEPAELSAHAPARKARWVFTRAGLHVLDPDAPLPAAVMLTAYELQLAH